MLTIPIKLHNLVRMLFGIPTSVSDISEDVDTTSDFGVSMSIHQTASYVSQALSFASEKDGIASCRLHREFGKERKPRYKSEEKDTRIYLTYLWESAEKIIESSRHLSTNPNHLFSIDLKSEMKVLSNSISRLSDGTSEKSYVNLREIIEQERSFVKHAIETRSKKMRHEDFNDGSLEYSYLTLLYHIHSFLNAASRLLIIR